MNNRSRLTPHALRLTPYVLRLTFYICFLLSCLFLAATISAQQTITYQAYLSRIGRWREQVRLVQGPEEANCAPVLAAVAEEMAGITAVQMPNGSTMSVSHENISLALRAAPCDPARADSLLAGICPNQICPVGALPSNPNNTDAAGSLPIANPSQLPGTPSPDVVQQLEELRQEGQPGTSGPEQPGINATPGSQNEPGEVGGGEAGGNEPAGSTGNTAETGESSSIAESETPASGSATAESGTTQTGEGEATGETSPEAGTGGPEDDAEGAGAESGSEAGSTEAAGEAGQAAVEGAGTEETPKATAETALETTAGDPAATIQPPEIAPPVETETSPWLWVIVALAVIIIVVGAILFIFSQPGDGVERQRRRQEPGTAEAAVDEGRELVAAGNYRGAIRHLFLAALLTLDERNLIQYDKTRTNYELLHEVELRATIVETLTPVVETFERVWYGFETVGAAEYELLVGQIELLKQA